MTPEEANNKLFEAARSGKLNDAVAALDAGADPNARSDKKWTPLHWAAGNGHAALARLLIEKGADPNARDDLRLTPLHWTAAKIHADDCMLDVARLLIEKGADPNARDDRRRTPLHWAAFTGHADLLELLRDAAGANTHAGRVAKPLGNDEPQVGG